VPWRFARQLVAIVSAGLLFLAGLFHSTQDLPEDLTLSFNFFIILSCFLLFATKYDITPRSAAFIHSLLRPRETLLQQHSTFSTSATTSTSLYTEPRSQSLSFPLITNKRQPPQRSLARFDSIRSRLF
jgi:hypothetical protein